MAQLSRVEAVKQSVENMHTVVEKSELADVLLEMYDLT